MDTKVNIKHLLEKIKENQENHKRLFEKALKGYQKEMEEILITNLELIRKGDKAERYIALPIPEDHTSDYNRIITMLEMDVRVEIELDEMSFAKYVMDHWEWTDQWTTSNSVYLTRTK